MFSVRENGIVPVDEMRGRRTQAAAFLATASATRDRRQDCDARRVRRIHRSKPRKCLCLTCDFACCQRGEGSINTLMSAGELWLRGLNFLVYDVREALGNPRISIEISKFAPIARELR